MNNQTIYWVWLQQVCGYGSSKISKVRKRYTFAEDFYKAPYEEKMLCFDGKEDALNFRDVFDRKLYNAEKIIRYCRDNDIEIVVPGDENYPELLLPLTCLTKTAVSESSGQDIRRITANLWQRISLRDSPRMILR